MDYSGQFKKLILILGVFLLVFSLAPAASFADWEDHFDGTSGYSWITFDTFVGTGDISSAQMTGGQYEFEATNVSGLNSTSDPTDDYKYLLAGREGEVEDNAIIKAKMSALEEQDLLAVLVLRGNRIASGGTYTHEGYGCGVCSYDNDGYIYIGKTKQFRDGTQLTFDELSFDPAVTDCYIKFAAITAESGQKLFGKAWPVGGDEPKDWQIDYTDDSAEQFASGLCGMGVMTWSPDINGTGPPIFESKAAFDDIYLFNTNLAEKFSFLSETSDGGEVPAGGSDSFSAGDSVVDISSSSSFSSLVSVAEDAEPAPTKTKKLGTEDLIDKSVNIDCTLLDGEHQSMVKISYSDDEVAGLNEENLNLYYYDNASGSWRLAVAGNTNVVDGNLADVTNRIVGSIPDITSLGDYGVYPENNVVWAVVDHFTEFGVGGTGDNGWALQDGNLMIEGDDSQPETTVTINDGNSYVWIADSAASSETTYESESWGGQLKFDSAVADTDSFSVEVGYSTDGSTFSAGAPEATLNGDWSDTIEIDTGADGPLTVAAGEYLALRITNNSGDSGSGYTLLTGGLRSWLNAPAGGGNNLYIKSDAETDPIEDSTGTHDVTSNGPVTVEAFGKDAAMAFDGSGDYLSVPVSGDWDFGGGDFTIDLWVNADSLAGLGGLLKRI
ncbi:MAG: hypothetical protein U5L07_11090 [Desulfobacterales bacterium]|nr:hypothetical protein [Desulfobacterales bacterium]